MSPATSVDAASSSAVMIWREPARSRPRSNATTGVALADERADGPGADAAERARDEEPLAALTRALTPRPRPRAAPTSWPAAVRRAGRSPRSRRSRPSPSARNRGGSRKTPTPPGVPVAMTSPGSRRERLRAVADDLGDAEEHRRRCSPTGDARRRPCRRSRASCGSPISSAVTSAGPIGQNVSSDLPRTHWPSPNWRSRAETSFEAGVAEDVVEGVRLGRPAARSGR